MKKIYNKYDAPTEKEVFASNPGAAVYKYVDGNGDKQEVNMQEKIQSYLPQVDYKKRIENGMKLEVPISENVTMVADATGFPDNSVDMVQLINAIDSLSPDALAQILASGSQSQGQGNQTTAQSTEDSGQTQEITTQTGQTQPIAGTTGSGTVEGGAQ